MFQQFLRLSSHVNQSHRNNRSDDFLSSFLVQFMIAHIYLVGLTQFPFNLWSVTLDNKAIQTPNWNQTVYIRYEYYIHLIILYMYHFLIEWMGKQRQSLAGLCICVCVCVGVSTEEREKIEKKTAKKYGRAFISCLNWKNIIIPSSMICARHTKDKKHRMGKIVIIINYNIGTFWWYWNRNRNRERERRVLLKHIQYVCVFWKNSKPLQLFFLSNSFGFFFSYFQILYSYIADYSLEVRIEYDTKSIVHTKNGR